ncbi:NACHT domain-containing NTPase [Fortiea sp. LEGE XX443]|uniref:NACHT domain-containing protein n=1 Tax=Fortiea sp. LEGE XX443 TaxID=1828611 RepID=UPI001882D18D|nr:NACHT domain-containing NTPase [Fortiea sp. LEGE XX443]MBE9006854.1 NACHT domain-containing NTPase [Fortiea sp. LEGE XX443]
MAERSLQASQNGIQLARQALTSKRLFQKDLVGMVCQSRQPISKFFTGKPVDREIFVAICERLSLKWQDIANLPPVDELMKVGDNTSDIATVVKEVREKIKSIIEERYSTMRVLDMTQPIGLNDIYTNVNILEKITGRRRLGIEELLQQCTSDDFNHFGLVKITEKRLPALEAVEKHSKLMILGKPGAGKTTFLKYLAIQCIRGEFQAERVPIFITLKDFAEATNKPTLLEYITEQTINGVSKAHNFIKKEFITSIHYVIAHGKTLFLLDGLDEIKEEDSKRVLREIRDFSNHFQDNNFVMTCRIAAREYTFEKFTEVEVADFDDQQIVNFTNNWFKGKPVTPETFIQRLKQNRRIQELAASPLLLTLLCLAFEESGDFPANRSELYKEGLDALLKKWDAKRGIQRDQVYKKLSVQRKEDLLSKIALTTFESGDYFFKQKIAEQYITEYIRNLPGANTDEEALQLDSEEVLRSIEHHHGLLVARAKGIYSFSHLTFHEYFTAREIVFVKQSSEEALQSLIVHVTEKRWREVFLLAVGMSPNADHLLLLMKDKIDAILSDDENLQNLLRWSNEKSLAVDSQYKKSIKRAFYFAFAVTNEVEIGYPRLVIVLHFLHKIIFNPVKNPSLAKKLSNFIFNEIFREISNNISSKDVSLSLIHHIYPNYKVVGFDDKCILFLALAPQIKQALLQLKEQLPTLDIETNLFKQWWIINGQNWIEQLSLVMNQYNDCPDTHWQFNQEDKNLIQQYHDANVLLMECLNSNCYVSYDVRQYIENTLLLPIAEIKPYQQ